MSSEPDKPSRTRLVLAVAAADPDARADVLHVSAVRLIRRLGRAASALTDAEGRGGGVRLPEAHEALDTLTAAAVQLLAVVVRGEAPNALVVPGVLVLHVVVRARRVLLVVQTLTVR